MHSHHANQKGYFIYNEKSQKNKNPILRLFYVGIFGFFRANPVWFPYILLNFKFNLFRLKEMKKVEVPIYNFVTHRFVNNFFRDFCIFLTQSNFAKIFSSE